jgi:Tol biopolymer transport system component
MSLSHDGKQLVYVREERDPPRRTLIQYDPATGTSRDLITGFVGDAHLSSDGRQIAFLKLDDGIWQTWVMSTAGPAKNTVVSRKEVTTLVGWAAQDSALVCFDETNLYWLSLDGKIQKSIPMSTVYQKDFEWMSTNVVRLNPVNPDLIAFSGYRVDTPQDAAVDDTERNATVMVVDLKTGRRSLLLNPKDWAHEAVWSADGVWLYFTRQEAPRRLAIWRMRADGSGLERVTTGAEPVVA